MPLACAKSNRVRIEYQPYRKTTLRYFNLSNPNQKYQPPGTVYAPLTSEDTGYFWDVATRNDITQQKLDDVFLGTAEYQFTLAIGVERQPTNFTAVYILDKEIELNTYQLYLWLKDLQRNVEPKPSNVNYFYTGYWGEYYADVWAEQANWYVYLFSDNTWSRRVPICVSNGAYAWVGIKARRERAEGCILKEIYDFYLEKSPFTTWLGYFRQGDILPQNITNNGYVPPASNQLSIGILSIDTLSFYKIIRSIIPFNQLSIWYNMLTETNLGIEDNIIENAIFTEILRVSSDTGCPPPLINIDCEPCAEGLCKMCEECC